MKMSEPFLNEMGEELEGTEELSREMQELSEMTHEPESYMEGKIDVAQSEAIESSFNQLVNNRTSGEEVKIPALDGSSKPGSDRTGSDEADEVECDPIPLPYPASEVESSPPEGPGEGQAPAAEDDWESPNVYVAIDPDPIWRETGETSIDPAPIFREAEQVVAVFDGSSFSLQSSTEGRSTDSKDEDESEPGDSPDVEELQQLDESEAAAQD
jgi:hypothetical protein